MQPGGSFNATGKERYQFEHHTTQVPYVKLIGCEWSIRVETPDWTGSDDLDVVRLIIRDLDGQAADKLRNWPKEKSMVITFDIKRVSMYEGRHRPFHERPPGTLTVVVENAAVAGVGR